MAAQVGSARCLGSQALQGARLVGGLAVVLQEVDGAVVEGVVRAHSEGQRRAVHHRLVLPRLLRHRLPPRIHHPALAACTTHCAVQDCAIGSTLKLVCPAGMEQVDEFAQLDHDLAARSNKI